MKRFKKIAMVFTLVAAMGASGVAYAATNQTPAEIAAGLTGQTVQTMNQERAAGRTYGAIANDAGKLAEFQSQRLAQRKVILDQRVAAGTLTQEKADTIYNAMKDHQADCDGTGSVGMGRNAGLGRGQGNGMGNGPGPGGGAGFCDGSGLGAGQGSN
ncbi:MAG: DUF2680 domain-containing protein [Firmicutes bacterium]|nr:DUF2680 domain-containing protein [Bacillota bacterium]